MTKEKILRKHFKAEFGHDGHGKFMQYILAAMEEYAQQQVKNCSIPDDRHSMTGDMIKKKWCVSQKQYTVRVFDTYDQAVEYCEENYLAKSLINPIDG